MKGWLAGHDAWYTLLFLEPKSRHWVVRFIVLKKQSNYEFRPTQRGPKFMHPNQGLRAYEGYTKLTWALFLRPSKRKLPSQPANQWRQLYLTRSPQHWCPTWMDPKGGWFRQVKLKLLHPLFWTQVTGRIFVVTQLRNYSKKTHLLAWSSYSTTIWQHILWLYELEVMVGALSHARYVSCILYMFGFDDKLGISKTAIIEKGHGKNHATNQCTNRSGWWNTPRNNQQKTSTKQPRTWSCPTMCLSTLTIHWSILHLLWSCAMFCQIKNWKVNGQMAKWQYVILGSTRRKSISNGSIITTRVISAKGRFRSPNHKQQPTTNEPPPNWTIWS